MFIISSGYADNSSTDEFVSGGKPFAKVFYNFHSHHVDGTTVSAFEIKRAYLGFAVKLSDNLSIKTNIDVGNPKNGSIYERRGDGGYFYGCVCGIA